MTPSQGVAFSILVAFWVGVMAAWVVRYGHVTGEHGSGSTLDAPDSVRLVVDAFQEEKDDVFVLSSTHLRDGPLRVRLHRDSPLKPGHACALVVESGKRLVWGAVDAALAEGFDALVVVAADLDLDQVVALRDRGVALREIHPYEDPWSQATAHGGWSTVTVADGSDAHPRLRPTKEVTDASPAALAVADDGKVLRNDDWWASIGIDPPPCLTRGKVSGWTVKRSHPTVWKAVQVARGLDLRSDLCSGIASLPAALLLAGCPLVGWSRPRPSTRAPA